jgi:hypothetical protein
MLLEIHMPNYKEPILRHEKEVNRLHSELKNAVKYRDRSPSFRESWIRAAAEYRNHHSFVDDWIQDIRNSEISDWADARDFVFQFLEVDPIYNNSGYAKELMVQKIKACRLSEKEAAILRALIIKRIQTYAWRDFRRFCQLIPRIQNADFIDTLTHYAQVKDRDVSRRAKFAIQYLTPTKNPPQ